MTEPGYDPTDSEAFRAAFGAWSLTMIDKGAPIDQKHLNLFKFAFSAGYAYGESE